MAVNEAAQSAPAVDPGSVRAGVGGFLARLGLFLLPFAPVLGLPAYVLWKAGELVPVSDIVAGQAAGRGPDLFGVAYTNPNEVYKAKMAVARSPRILALGTSRAMQIRSGFFADSGSFYNAGGGSYEIHNLARFLARIPAGREPEILLLVLDQFYYNRDWKATREEVEMEGWEGRHRADDIVVANWKAALTDWAKGKYRLSDLDGKTDGLSAAGITALARGDGFRRDGSYRYGDIRGKRLAGDPSQAMDRRFALQERYLAEGIDNLPHGAFLNVEAVEGTARFLALCKARGIHVVGFLPPYPNRVDSLMRASGNFGYMDSVAPALAIPFREAGYPLFDFPRLASLGAGDEEAVDGLHGTEKAYLRMIMRAAEGDSLLAREVDAEMLKALLEGSPNGFEVFPEPYSPASH